MILTPVVAARPGFPAPVGLSVAEDPSAVPVPVVAGAQVPEMSSEEKSQAKYD